MLKKQFVKSRQVAKVTFELAKSEIPDGIEPETVFLVGGFNDWDPDATPMKYSKKKKAYWAMLELEPGQAYQFRYYVNSEFWCNDWQADAYVSTGHGDDNGLVNTPSAANGS